MTNSHGEGVQAALGLQVVDEAVFALAEKQPGFAKVFFYLEQEAHEAALRDPLHRHAGYRGAGAAAPRLEQRDRAARALFAATEMVSTNKFETEVGRTVPQTKYGEYYATLPDALPGAGARLAESLSQAYRRKTQAATCRK